MGSEDALARLALATPEQPVALGRYDVLGRLGRGGMGTVYDAIDRERSARVAVKTLTEVDAAAAVRIKREFRAVADLAHPNLATVFELAQVDGLWFFAMERIDGVGFTRWARGPSRNERTTSAIPVTRADLDLDATTRNLMTGPVPGLTGTGGIAPSLPMRSTDELRSAMADLARALTALHDAGLRHGDVKPENMLVRPDGRVVLVDFGLAEPIGASRVRRGTTAGTPLYMAPEQLAGVDAGPPSDWYAVGTMLYEVLTGRMPFEADSLLDLYFQKSHHTPPAPREILDEVPDDLSDVCLALLQNAPDRRPGGAEVLRIFAGDNEARRRLADRTVRSAFVGRKRELRDLEMAYGLARAKRPTVVHAIGPSGIGKSAMLRSFARGVEDIDGALVLRGRCYERESVPYNAFDGVVDDLAEYLATLGPAMLNPVLPAWIGELARVFPALDSVPAIAARALPADTVLEAVELRRRAWTALRELLAAVSHASAVVVIIDDLHWADADSARLLERIVSDASRARMFFVAGFRPAEAAANRALADYLALGRRLTGEGRLFELSVGPLPPAEAELLARATLRDLGGQASERRLRFLAEEAQGVPFFIEELARFVAGRDDALDEDVSLDHAIRARVQALPAEQRGLLEMAAVADIPVPQSLLFTAAGLAAGALPSLLALRSGSLVGWSGAGVDDRVSVYHDRIRESVIASLDDGARARSHLALGRAMATRHFAEPGAWAFEAVRHLSAAGALLDDATERLTTARLAREAGRQARQAAAFPLAFACFERGIALLPPDAWATSYQLALDLHSGAAETAYLIADWGAMDARCAAIKTHARTALDQIVSWEAQIDAFIGRHDYVAALDVGLQALSLLGVELPRDPGQADIAAAFERTLADLSTMTPETLSALPDVDDPTVAAAMRIQVRISPGAFFGKPVLLPIIACNLVQTSIKRGLSMATPFALALFGIVLNTVGLFPVSHAWGQLAVSLLARWQDRRLEAATRHLVFNLVCPWMVPLSSILAPLREVWDIGRRTGDLEYASYAAHGYIHNAMYAGRPLGPLVIEAREIGAQMRALGQVNALHVHEPFEKLLEAYTGKLRHAPRLDDDDFNEQARLDAAAREGSRSGCFIVHLAIGLARFYLGDRRDASTHFEQARSFLDAAPSTWHIPILHQHAALAACLSGNAALRPKIEESLAALRALAAHTPANFAHRVSMVEAELARLDGDAARARDCLAAARVAALDGEWTSDVALVDELSGDYTAARDGYAAWGATAIAARFA